MSNQDWSEPPGALPDGSIPLYGSYPLPGTPGGGPRPPEVGWGPEFGESGDDASPVQFRHFQHGGPQPTRRRTGLGVSLLLLGGVAVAVVIVALALRDGDSTTVAPAPDPATTALGSNGTSDGNPSSQDSEKVVTADAFYGTGVQRSVNCREPQVALNRPAAVQTYYANLVGCLNRAWAPTVQAAEDTFTAPRVIFWSGTTQSPCASGSLTSFYCGTSQTLYLKYADDIKLWNRSTESANQSFARMWATYTAGHEFGHHLQQLTGILPAARELEYDAPNREVALELSRRVELQASCLGTLFMGANKNSYGITGLDLTIYRRYVEAQTGDENNRGGPRDHGARASHQYWTARGFNTHNSANCNTFTASASKVS